MSARVCDIEHLGDNTEQVQIHLNHYHNHDKPNAC